MQLLNLMHHNIMSNTVITLSIRTLTITSELVLERFTSATGNLKFAD